MEKSISQNLGFSDNEILDAFQDNEELLKVAENLGMLEYYAQVIPN